MDLETDILSEISQTQTNIVCSLYCVESKKDDDKVEGRLLLERKGNRRGEGIRVGNKWN